MDDLVAHRFQHGFGKLEHGIGKILRFDDVEHGRGNAALEKIHQLPDERHQNNNADDVEDGVEDSEL